MVSKKSVNKFYLIFLLIIVSSSSFIKNKAQEIKWEKTKYKEDTNDPKEIEWERYYPDSSFDESNIDFVENEYQKNTTVENQVIDKKEFFYLGFAVPNAFVMDQNDFMIYADQLFPFYKSDLEEGTANQNYSVFSSYGINNRMMLMGFFSHSDDPLYREINNVSKQPANKWVSLGLGSRLNIFNNNKFLTSLDTSFESWFVKSGGCNGIGCESNSSNIFDQSLNVFNNMNLVGSIALPNTIKVSEKTSISFSPKITFLPEKQFHEESSGSFYGLNSGIGLGFLNELTKRFHFYSSAYIPFSGKNYFDKNLTFKKSIIYDLGFSYLIDPKVSFQGYLSNSFGSTPATGILTIPSDNNLIIGTRLVYKPTSLDLNMTKDLEDKKTFEGLSVTNTELVQPNKVLFDFSIDKDLDIWTTITAGISRNFNFEISTGRSNKKPNTKSNFYNSYIGSNQQHLRFGGKAILIKQNKKFPITSGVRMSFGRFLGDSWPGYLFIENVNTRKLSKRIKFNLTPKIAWTASGNPSAIGSSLIFEIFDNYSFILERNTAIKHAQSNFTSALRVSNNENRYLDLYLTNAVNFNDIGELINAKEIAYGLKMGIKF